MPIVICPNCGKKNLISRPGKRKRCRNAKCRQILKYVETDPDAIVPVGVEETKIAGEFMAALTVEDIQEHRPDLHEFISNVNREEILREGMASLKVEDILEHRPDLIEQICQVEPEADDPEADDDDGHENNEHETGEQPNPDYEGKTKAKLVAIAEDRDFSDVAKLNKTQLIELLKENDGE